MSNVLRVRPFHPGYFVSLPAELKLAIQGRLFNNETGPIQFERSDWEGYFEGLEDAGVPGADEVLRIFRKYQTVEMWIE